MAVPVTIAFSGFAHADQHARIEDVISGRVKPFIANSESLGTYFACIGTAECTITLYQQDEFVRKQVEELNRQLQEQRARARQAEQAILDKISKLTALTYESQE